MPPRDTYAEVGAAMRWVLQRAIHADGMGPTAWRVLAAVLWLTASWSKLSDHASHAQVGELAGFDMDDPHRRRALSRQLAKLAEEGLIEYEPGASRPGEKRVPSRVGLPRPPVVEDRGCFPQPPALQDRGSAAGPPAPQDPLSGHDPRSPSDTDPRSPSDTTPGPPGPPFRGITEKNPPEGTAGAFAALLETRGLHPPTLTPSLATELTRLETLGWQPGELIHAVWTRRGLALNDPDVDNPAGLLLNRLQQITTTSPTRQRDQRLADQADHAHQLEHLDQGDPATATKARAAIRHTLAGGNLE